ncbi:DUF5682 family protein [Catenuloplanes atrovinosus]|uniref:Uncharacterized protein n=1 Tax=Catenuloplanes atrovinosus TaxID=137266 RepID=A0AAE3YXQ6_9ACTN|nr:DUF5682 family protein [Catenuloplanes atrovinosus]MDR7279876.1 hypothetical protein [Catenuloplanes atrovinosus]
MITFIGVRHHSPACARLVDETIRAVRPAYVLVEGPVEMNARIGELLLGHQLPIAVFSSYADGERHHASWAPFCDYSPEWTALTAGRAVGAELRFIDLPAWHPAFADRRNRYADAEQRYAEVIDRLCREFAVDNVDTLWDHLFEVAEPDGLAERLAAYFDLIRGEAEAGADDVAREAYMASWIRRTRREAGDRPIVVVTGGFHRPALVRLAALPGDDEPVEHALPADASGGSYLVPYSFRRLDSFDGYQSGMPSPAYYQRLFEDGLEAAADHLLAAVVARLRGRGQRLSTADLIAATASAAGLALVRGHRHRSRTDVLDGLASALLDEALDVPLPWSTRGTPAPGTHPVVVEMVAALSGDRTGRLHPDTPAPPLVHHAVAELARHDLDRDGNRRLDLARDDEREVSRVLHRLRILGVPGFTRRSGPRTGIDPQPVEEWTLARDDRRLPALIEAGGYGATLGEAAGALLAERVLLVGGDVERLAAVLFDAALAGIPDLPGRVLDAIGRAIGATPEMGPLGRVLEIVLALWRHDRLLGTAGSAPLGTVIAESVARILWLAEGVRGGAAPADLPRIAALAAVRDALVHAGAALDLDRDAALDVAARLALSADAPPDLRGAGFGFGWSLGAERAGDPARVVRGAFTPSSAGDWLAGLFALAREEVLQAGGVLDVLDEAMDAMGDEDFLIALPALRQAFEFFPPRERDTIARHLLARRGIAGDSRALLRLDAAPDLIAAGVELDGRVADLLHREGLITT